MSKVTIKRRKIPANVVTALLTGKAKLTYQIAKFDGDVGGIVENPQSHPQCVEVIDFNKDRSTVTYKKA